MTRVFNAREGAAKDLDTLPSRMFREPLNDGVNKITEEEIKYMVDEYYRLRGWNKNGYPLADV